jgi:putative nucleotidyltransferase with HDIG domain
MVTQAAAGTPISLKQFVPAYTTAVAIIGFALLSLAVVNLPEDHVGLAIFTLLVIISELGSVELFRSSRGSSVSASLAVSIAAILAIGPLAGVLIQVASGLTSTVVKMQKQEIQKNKASWVRVSSFNIGMFMISTTAAGLIYYLAGGRTETLLDVRNILPLTLAVTVDTVTNILLLIGVIFLQTGRHPYIMWKQDFQWSVPITIITGIIGGGALALAYSEIGLLGVAVFFIPILAIGYSFRIYANDMRGMVNRLETLNEALNKANQQLQESNIMLRENNIELLETMAAVIDTYDDYTHRHSTHVAKFAGALAQGMGLPVDQQDQIMRASLLHDIGKIGVNLDQILHKNGRLTEEEYASIRRHPTTGAEIIRRMHTFTDLVPLILYHHEKYNGSGYPSGLAGEQIPLGARIITLADSLEAMLSDRPYRSGLDFSSAVAEVLRCSGSHFDPRVVNAFLKIIAEQGTNFFTEINDTPARVVWASETHSQD